MEHVCTDQIGIFMSLYLGHSFSSALYTDSCLYIVPRSHKIPRSPEQRRLSETLDPPEDPLEMPGAMQLTLRREFLGVSSSVHDAEYSH